MIRTLNIDGFKNLKNISVDLRPGLNVLVGPNGTGKSNILSALEFVSSLFKFNLDEVLWQMGLRSTYELFWIPNFQELGSESNNISLNDQDQVKQMVISIIGSTNVSIFNPTKERLNSEITADDFVGMFMDYEYKCTIEYNAFDQIPLTYQTQSTKLKFKPQDDKNIESSIDVIFRDGDIKFDSVNSDMLTEYTGISVDTLKQALMGTSGNLITESLLTKLEQNFFPVSKIVSELNFSKAFRISTNLIRYDEQVFDRNRMRFDGKGLYSTLVYLKLNDETLFRRLVEDFSRISNQIFDVEISDTGPKQSFKILVKIQPDPQLDSYSYIPIELLSDGLLKWFSLVIAIKLSQSNLMIDEPDVHLDTEMHTDLVEILRNQYKRSNQFGIITTHNETLVNLLEPNELIIINSQSGDLNVSRINQLPRLEKDMNELGFSLGWYFHTGAINSYVSKPNQCGEKV